MANVSGFVYYDPTRNAVPGTGLKNIPVALYNTGTGTGVVALTDATGAYRFTNVPAGAYKIIETWGTPGTATPVSFATAAAMAIPAEVEPPLSVVTVATPPLADALDAITPNLLNVTVAAADLSGQNFYDGPVGYKPLTLAGVTAAGSNLITAAANGTWGSFPGGTVVNTTAGAVAPYPGVTPGFTYTSNITPNDGSYNVMNVRSNTFPWWNVSDHTTGLEIGRYITVNGSNPGSIIFTQPVAVTPNSEYGLTAWIANLINANGFAKPQLALRVLGSDGSTIFFQNVNPISATPAQPVWYQNGFLFNSGAFNSITVQILSEGPAATGNDYLIDDVALYRLTVQNLLTLEKKASPAVIHPGDDVTFTVTVTNNSSTATLNPVTFQDVLDPTLTFVPGSVTVDNIANAGNPNTGFSLGSMAPGAVHTVVFHATALAGASPVKNIATGAYPISTSANGDIILNTVPSNPTFLRRPLYNFSRPATDIATSVALEQAGLSHILNAEGEKIQAMLAVHGVTATDLLNANASVQGMIDSISTLECILKQKLKTVKNQLVGYQTF